jgi:hypothetical protein
VLDGLRLRGAVPVLHAGRDRIYDRARALIYALAATTAAASSASSRMAVS